MIGIRTATDYRVLYCKGCGLSCTVQLPAAFTAPAIFSALLEKLPEHGTALHASYRGMRDFCSVARSGIQLALLVTAAVPKPYKTQTVTWGAVSWKQ
jgi:hypothetical protein